MRTETPVALLLVLSAAWIGCDPLYTLCGHVTRCSDDKPLVGVHILVRASGEHYAEGYTEPDGTWCSTFMGAGPPSPLEVQYDKPGYASEWSWEQVVGDNLPPVCMEESCEAGDEQPSTCENGIEGTQTCDEDGRSGPCEGCRQGDSGAGVD